MVKLDAMENPYPLPQELVEPWLQVLRDCSLNRYPDPVAAALAQRVRSVHGVPSQSALMFGNGSDELIQVILTALAKPGATVLAPEPGFVMYRQLARSLGLNFVGVPLRAGDFGLDLDAMIDAIRRERPVVVFLAYPNNPTGNLFAEAEMLAVLECAPGVVVIDEAYAPFAGRSFLPGIHRHPNALLMRTLSKLGLAGLRLGYLAGEPLWLEQFDKLRLPYNIGALTQASADFALSRYAAFEAQTQLICDEREALYRELSSIELIEAFPSDANFILFRTLDHGASQIFDALRAAGILIKNLAAAGGLLADCLRVTVGTAEENRRFLSALQHSLQVVKPG